MRRADALGMEKALAIAGFPGSVYPLPEGESDACGIELCADGSLKDVVGTLTVAGFFGDSPLLWYGGETHQDGRTYAQLFIFDPTVPAENLTEE